MVTVLLDDAIMNPALISYFGYSMVILWWWWNEFYDGGGDNDGEVVMR